MLNQFIHSIVIFEITALSKTVKWKNLLNHFIHLIATSATETFVITVVSKRVKWKSMFSHCMKEINHSDENIHVESVHSFDCDICDYNFEQNSKMNKHILQVYEGEKPFGSDQTCCISSFIWVWYLWLQIWWVRFTNMFCNCMKERSHLDANFHVESVNSFDYDICDYSFE